MQISQLKIFTIDDTCTGCGACVSSCPKSCISMNYNAEGFWYPEMIDKDACINCHKCEKSCHVLSRRAAVQPKEKPSWWGKSEAGMFFLNDALLREQSTSGGAMTLIAKYIIDQGGVVYTTRYNGASRRLEFASSDDFPLSIFRKSRYFESFTSDSFSKVRKSLEAGRPVLFISTPCQVSGLKHYLGSKADDENLITVNFVCHGVPSNEVFHNYMESKYRYGRLANVDSRYQDKRRGWHSLNMKILTEASREYIIPYSLDSFCMSFVKGEYLRRCCYTCDYLFTATADITIGDYWGIKFFQPELDDNKGISLIILHTEKSKIFKRQAEQLGKWGDVPYQSLAYILAENKSRNIEARFVGNKDEFVSHLLKDYRIVIWKNRIKSLVKRILGK